MFTIVYFYNNLWNLFSYNLNWNSYNFNWHWVNLLRNLWKNLYLIYKLYKFHRSTHNRKSINYLSYYRTLENIPNFFCFYKSILSLLIINDQFEQFTRRIEKNLKFANHLDGLIDKEELLLCFVHRDLVFCWSLMDLRHVRYISRKWMNSSRKCSSNDKKTCWIPR